MAYENYTQVAWTAGTPITSERLQQMSENIQQVKEATDDNPRGLIKIKQVTSSISHATMDTYHEIINLKNEGGGVDNSVTLPGSRYIRLNLVFPGIQVSNPGQEDATYVLRLTSGNVPASGTVIYNWKIHQPIHTYLNAAAGAPTTANTTIRSAPIIFGAGTYTFVTTTSAGIAGSNGSGVFNVEIYRDSGSSAANPSTFTIPCNENRMQFYVEDIGGQG